MQLAYKRGCRKNVEIYSLNQQIFHENFIPIFKRQITRYKYKSEISIDLPPFDKFHAPIKTFWIKTLIF